MDKFIKLFNGFHTFWLGIVFSLGIGLGFIISFSWLTMIICFISLIGLWLMTKQGRQKTADLLMLISFFSLGMVWIMPSCLHQINKFSGQANEYVLKVSSIPQELDNKNTFIAEVKKINDLKTSFTAFVVDYTQQMQFMQNYRVSGSLAVRKTQNNQFYQIWIKTKALPVSLPISWWDDFSRKSTLAMMTVFKNNCSDQAFRFLSSVFLGRRELLAEQKQIFVDSGISHLLAISGSNIALNALVLFFILKFFYVPYRIRLIVSLVFLYAYTIITGANPPVLRATVMYTIFTLGFLSKRKINEWNCFGLAAMILLLAQPLWLFDLGFQLSFVCVAALIMGFKVFDLYQSANPIVQSVAYTFWATVFATICVNPLVSYYFGRIYFISILHNIVLIPFFTIIMQVNFLLLICSPIVFFAQSIGAVISILVSWFMSLSQVLGQVPLSYLSIRLSGLGVFIYYVFLSIIIFSFSRLIAARNSLTK